MLQNYMHLIQALHIGDYRFVNEDSIGQYLHHYKTFLEGYVQLYKEAPVMPNHHLCLHIIKFLRLFGPVHSWRSWVFERFNRLLQQITTNTHFGELFDSYSVCSQLIQTSP